MQIILFALALLSPLSSFAAGKFCDPPNYVVRAPASLPDMELDSLLSRKERENPASLPALIQTPGPYGHSQLGFRFLARAFGYKGDTSEPDKVELWLAEREYKDPQYHGSLELWEKWVREPEYKLKPRNEGTSLISFFNKPGDALEYSACLATDLARNRCENYSSKKIIEGARVYYGKESSRSPCAIRYNGGIQGDAPDKITSSFSCIKAPGQPERCNSSTDKSWTWANSEKSAGGSGGTSGAAK
jgi:hypothetical protein